MSDPWHASVLEFEQIHAARPVFSVGIGSTGGPSAFCSDDAAIWYFIGSLADYDKLIKTL